MAPAAKILVVDDNPSNRSLAQAVLEDEDYEVVLGEDGEQALRLFETEAPDCVLLDVRMPGMDGLEVCRRLRKLSAGSDTPVVFLTAQRDVETFDAALEAGGDDFVTKPVHPTELLVRVQVALKLRRASAELRELYELVKRQRDDLMRLQLQKERLSSFLVHDMKNPVSALDLTAQYALRDPELSEKTRRALLKMRDESKTLLRLILNLLDISKSDESGLTPRHELIDVGALIQGVIEELELKASSAGVSFEHDVQASDLCGDVDLLRRVLANLLENAIRHAPEDSAVEIRTRLEEAYFRIEVSDSGPGVPADLRHKIFDPFVQLDEGERVVTRAGRGLGLAFCRVAVEAHGGDIIVEAGDPGAVFVVRLPLTKHSNLGKGAR